MRSVRRPRTSSVPAVALVAVLVALVTVLSPLAAPAPAPAVAAEADGHRPQLRTEGRWLVDPRGRTVMLHGVNAVWKRPPYCPPDEPGGLTAADADFLAANGFNTVRLGVLFVGVMPEEGVIDERYLDCVDRVVDLLAQRGIWVMLDFHQDMYNERFGGEGFPDWSTYDDGLPPPSETVDAGFPGNYFHPATKRAFDNLWGNREGLWERYGQAWQAVAERWRDQPHLMGYDLMNEPWPGSQAESCMNPQGCPLFDTQFLQPFWQHHIDAIREVDDDNIVWFGGNVLHNFGAESHLGRLEPIEGHPLGFKWNTYCLTGSFLGENAPEQTGEECEAMYRLVFENSEEDAQRLGTAIQLTEFGATDDTDDLERVLSLADEHLMGWQYWHYKHWDDPTTTGPGIQSMFERDDDLSSLKQDKADHLIRTYPQATAGEPLELSFDPETGDFLYRYAPREAASPTEIFVPVERHYPHGYEVEVQSARVTSPPDASLLTLRAESGADEVRVRLRARSEPRPGATDESRLGPAEDRDLPATGATTAAVGLVLLGGASAGRRLTTRRWPPPPRTRQRTSRSR